MGLNINVQAQALCENMNVGIKDCHKQREIIGKSGGEVTRYLLDLGWKFYRNTSNPQSNDTYAYCPSCISFCRGPISDNFLEV